MSGTSEFPDLISSFHSNINNFTKMYNEKSNDLDNTKENSFPAHFIYSSQHNSILHKYMDEKTIENPKEKLYEDFANLKDVYNESKSIFSLAYKPIKNPKLSSLNAKKKKDIVFFDFSGVYFTGNSSFRQFQKFSKIKILSLRCCGLLEIPSSLNTLPKRLTSIDLSYNFISTLPNELKWGQLEGLNLSNNAFCQWPNILEPEKFPKLNFLSLSMNNIISIPSFPNGFGELHSLDLSFTALKSFPQIILNSNKLTVLSLRGCDLMEGFSFEKIASMPRIKYLDISKIILISNDEKHVKVPSTLRILVANGMDKSKLPRGNYTVVN